MIREAPQGNNTATRTRALCVLLVLLAALGLVTSALAQSSATGAVQTCPADYRVSYSGNIDSTQSNVSVPLNDSGLATVNVSGAFLYMRVHGRWDDVRAINLFINGVSAVGQNNFDFLGLLSAYLQRIETD